MNKLKNAGVFSALLLSFALLGCSDESANSAGTDGTGRGGSTARMTISGDYLYAIAGSDVQLFTITNPQTPNPWTKVRVDWDIETLFPYGDYLLIGAATGMHILDNTDPGNPVYIADFRHARARDPVVAADGFAYVTLKTDPNGFNAVDELNVIDIQDINNPSLIDTLSMQGPSGLSLDGNQLFVCDDIAGIKIIDVSDPANVSAVDSIPGVDCLDVIAENGRLYVITSDQLLQYDYSNGTPVLLSELAVTGE